ncbi:adenine phosphoribosyltransferase [Candidatus Nitrosocosmicus sp. R]
MHPDISHIQNLIRNYPDFPKQGILFKDINPVFRDGKSLDILGNHFYDQFQKVEVDYVAGIEARGFILSTLLSLKFNKGVIMIRKAGKLPGSTIKQTYGIEYGTAVMELQSDSLRKGDRILIADDLLATGGTALAAASLVEDLGGNVAGFAFIIELSSLDGGKLLRERGYRVHSMVVY